MAGVGIVTRMFGTAVSGIAGFAGGTALGPVLSPVVQLLRNDVNAAYPWVPPDAMTMALGVAQGQVDPEQAASWAAMHGIGGKAFNALVDVANTGPQLGYAFEAWRRGLLTDGEFDTALKRTGLEHRWYEAMRGLHDVLLSSPELAMAQQQGFVDEARANHEAGLQGVTPERQQLRFDMAGLPPGIETALTILRRGLGDEALFAQIVREGHTKIKYTDVLLKLRRQLLAPSVAVRARLKGHIDTDEMHRRGAQWGYTADDMDLWELSEGRPATAHQILIGYRRGAHLPGAANVHEAIAIAVRQSDIRPEYTDLIDAGAVTYPSLFQLTRLVSSGTIDADTAAEWAHKSGLAAEVVKALHAEWASTSSGPTTDKNVAKAHTKAWTEAQSSYIAEESTAADVLPIFQLLGVPSPAQQQVLATWDTIRKLTRRQLSPTQIVKAIKQGTTNPATGQPWTKADGLQALLDRGYDRNDAETLLNE